MAHSACHVTKCSYCFVVFVHIFVGSTSATLIPQFSPVSYMLTIVSRCGEPPARTFIQMGSDEQRRPMLMPRRCEVSEVIREIQIIQW